MSCEASWLPVAVADTLAGDRAVLCWLAKLRGSIEEYDPLVTVRPDVLAEPEPPASARPDDAAFDEILSLLGKEIYHLDEFQKSFHPEQGEVSLSILNLFDQCLGEMADVRDANSDKCETSETSTEQITRAQTDCENTTIVNGDANEITGVLDRSACVSTLSDITFVTSTPANVCDSPSPDVKVIVSKAPPPVPPRRLTPKSPVSMTSFNIENDDDVEILESKPIESDSDSVSTCWSYKECSTDENDNNKDAYALVWSHSTGYHNSDKILRSVLSQNHATVSCICFDTASEFTAERYSSCALQEVGDRCGSAAEVSAPVAAMTPARPTDDGYEPVRDAITAENIYEEIEYSYTDEGFSCGGSVEVDSCSGGSEPGRDSPVYVNLRDHAAYAIPDDVIAWKNWLLDPYYNDDEEDEWITPEECAVYSREHKPPLVIPRITHYRTRHDRANANLLTYSPEEYVDNVSVSSGRRDADDWSPASERRYDPRLEDSPPLRARAKRFGSTENLLNGRLLQPAASSSGDSLDVEVRERAPQPRGRKARSLLAGKRREPVPAPRTNLGTSIEASIIHEGPVKRTKFSENGRKCRKNWTDCYMVLSPTALLFYKDQKTYQAGERSELVLALRGAQVVPAMQMHTRRHSRSLLLMPGLDNYLVQDAAEDSARHWLRLIQHVIYKLGPPPLAELPLPPPSPTPAAAERDPTPPAPAPAPRRQKAGGSSNEDLSDSTEARPDVRSRLKKFFAKRPPMETLVKKGIYKDEPVFGRNLEEVCPTTPPRVPEFVVACVREIERCEDNMKTDGLYRASGNLSQVQKIRLEVDQNRLSVLVGHADVHVLAGALKLFFRELKEPLIPTKFFARILAAPGIRPASARAAALRTLVKELPAPNRDTLQFLLQHLRRVTSHAAVNRMTPANLAIVFGPTLLWAPPAPAAAAAAAAQHNLALDCLQQNNVVDALLHHYNDIFE